MDAAIEAGSRRQSGMRPIQVIGLFFLLLAAVAVVLRPPAVEQ